MNTYSINQSTSTSSDICIVSDDDDDNDQTQAIKTEQSTSTYPSSPDYSPYSPTYSDYDERPTLDQWGNVISSSTRNATTVQNTPECFHWLESPSMSPASSPARSSLETMDFFAPFRHALTLCKVVLQRLILPLPVPADPCHLSYNTATTTTVRVTETPTAATTTRPMAIGATILGAAFCDQSTANLDDLNQ